MFSISVCSLRPEHFRVTNQGIVGIILGTSITYALRDFARLRVAKIAPEGFRRPSEASCKGV